MNCRNCQYALWNLRARECPECGAPFSPRDFEFVPNSVRFLCPQCGQAYYGTGARGHLEPDSFECVTCGTRTGMDDMVLLPAEGVEERQTSPDANPWLDQGRGRGFKTWLATIGQSLFTPGRLMRGTAVESSCPRAFWFATVTQTAAMLVTAVPLGLIFMLPALAAGPGTVPAALMFGAAAAWLAVVLGFILLGAVLWALCAHVLLLMTGHNRKTLRRTFQAICYSSGANSLVATPCVGQYLGIPWWVVSATIMVKEGHGIHGGRATFAVVTPPALLFLAFVGLYVVMIAAMISSGAASGGGFGGAAWAAGGLSAQQSQVQTVVQTLITRNVIDGAWPGHASELVADQSFNAWTFIDSNTATTTDDVPLGGDTSLDDLQSMTDGRRRQAAAAAAAAALPPGIVAHRVGDFVFTYHGVDMAGDDPGLWLAVMCADPDRAGSAPPGDVVAGSIDGAVIVYRTPEFAAALVAQNQLRAAAGLAPLPDPRTVTHRGPAAAGPATPEAAPP